MKKFVTNKHYKSVYVYTIGLFYFSESVGYTLEYKYLFFFFYQESFYLVTL